MLETAPAPTTRACVWMEAGVIGYRLCDRGYDCEHCLLDAALRAPLQPPDTALAGPGPAALVPRNRYYSTGHTWLLPVGDGMTWRLGIDAFAAALIGPIERCRFVRPGRELRTGDHACFLELEPGALAIRAPVPCRVLRPNSHLAERPRAACFDPYGDGWLIELAVPECAELLGLTSPDTARDRLAIDLARFTRTVALELIAGGCGRDALEAGDPLIDLAALIGPSRYLELLRDFIH